MPKPSKLADPAWCRERARKARAAQATPDYFIRKLVESANGLTAEQADQLRQLLPTGGTS